MATYSFLDVQATLVGIGGVVELANGAGASEEGITIEDVADKNEMVVGADGAVMHSLHASNAAVLTVNLLKTSPINEKLSIMCNLQFTSSSTHGFNTITIRNVVSGDTIVCAFCAFKRRPNITYAGTGGTMQWQFDCASVTEILGSGYPEK